jgi:pyruvate dehydrogenase E1 component
VQDGLKRMLEEQEDIWYYITLMNENYTHPGLKPEQRDGILKGMYLLQAGEQSLHPRVQLLGSGVILRESIAAAALLKSDWGVDADIWSCPSFNELRRDGMAATRHNMLHPTGTQQLPYVTECLKNSKGPVIAATDYMRAFADQIREYVPRRYKVLGTDGFGRSDSRANLRRFFEVNRYYITVAALLALAEDGEFDRKKVADAINKYGLDTSRAAPWTV